MEIEDAVGTQYTMLDPEFLSQEEEAGSSDREGEGGTKERTALSPYGGVDMKPRDLLQLAYESKRPFSNTVLVSPTIVFQATWWCRLQRLAMVMLSSVHMENWCAYRTA
jgi:hypothetical protein